MKTSKNDSISILLRASETWNMLTYSEKEVYLRMAGTGKVNGYLLFLCDYLHLSGGAAAENQSLLLQ